MNAGEVGKLQGHRSPVRIVLFREAFSHQFPAATDAEALVEVFDVDVDGVGRELQFDGHFFFTVAG